MFEVVWGPLGGVQDSQSPPIWRPDVPHHPRTPRPVYIASLGYVEYLVSVLCGWGRRLVVELQRGPSPSPWTAITMSDVFVMSCRVQCQSMKHERTLIQLIELEATFDAG